MRRGDVYAGDMMRPVARRVGTCFDPTRPRESLCKELPTSYCDISKWLWRRLLRTWNILQSSDPHISLLTWCSRICASRSSVHGVPNSVPKLLHECESLRLPNPINDDQGRLAYGFQTNKQRSRKVVEQSKPQSTTTAPVLRPKLSVILRWRHWWCDRDRDCCTRIRVFPRLALMGMQRLHDSLVPRVLFPCSIVRDESREASIDLRDDSPA
jgi:hypothetical protein